MDELLGIPEFPDYAHALNGLQVASSGPVTRVAAAVDASEASIRAAVGVGADLLLVHHGLFWGGLAPATGSRFRKLKTLFDAEIALYSAHLPLDAHPELGNCALLARASGVEGLQPFGAYKDTHVGVRGSVNVTRQALLARLTERLEDGVRVIAGGPDSIREVAVVTGAGASFLEEAARAGVDTLITGEAPHHAFHEAMELGINLVLGGHYATETFGVRALAARLEQQFGIPWDFLDLPTGL